MDAYVTVLRSLSKSCNYGTLEDTLIRDRIVVGIRDNATRKRLLQESKLTLKACVDTCRAAETTSAQIKAMDRGQASGITSDVHVINRNRKKVPTVGTECKFCGKPHSFSKRELCPAWGRICTICKEYNHFAQKCPSKAGKKFPQKTPKGLTGCQTMKRVRPLRDMETKSLGEEADIEEQVDTRILDKLIL